YTYRISKHEVTNAQYTEFLNAIDPTGKNSLALYNSNMSSYASGGIILNGGAANGRKYEVKSGRGKNPVIYVSFFDAMRFTNWLENGQGSGDTESGVYTIGSGTNEVRNPKATFFIPSEDEWYKAAYHKNDGVTGNYWNFPTLADTEPYSDDPSSLNTPDDTKAANFFKNDRNLNGYDDGFAVTGSTSDDDNQNYLTDVGAYSLATSPYGTFDQGGNVWEWNEAVISSSSRGVRGGGWYNSAGGLWAPDPNLDNPSDETGGVGFRVASTIPEPTTSALALAAVLFFIGRRRVR
ncbi:MAG: formylglycine-generating enzyme family protein, partial [Aeoliella sp.]